MGTFLILGPLRCSIEELKLSPSRDGEMEKGS